MTNIGVVSIQCRTSTVHARLKDRFISHPGPKCACQPLLVSTCCEGPTGSVTLVHCRARPSRCHHDQHSIHRRGRADPAPDKPDEPHMTRPRMPLPVVYAHCDCCVHRRCIEPDDRLPFLFELDPFHPVHAVTSLPRVPMLTLAQVALRFSPMKSSSCCRPASKTYAKRDNFHNVPNCSCQLPI